MLAKNKTSAFLMSVILIVTGIVGYWLLTEPLYPLKEVFRTRLEIFITAALFLGIAFVTSRFFYDEMDEDAYGWQGLARWAALGSLTGMVVSLLHRYGLSRVKDIPILETLFEFVLPVMTFFLLFWLIFRRNPFVQSRSVTKGGPSITNMRLILIIGGIATLVIGFAFLFLFSHGQVKAVLLGVGIVMMGWCGILTGATMHRGRRDGLEKRLGYFAGILTLIALVVLLAGILWP